MLQEPITDPKNFRLTLKPINPVFNQEWKLYKKQVEAFWIAEEIKWSGADKDHFYSLKVEEQYCLKMVLAFFASSDGIVNYNLRERFLIISPRYFVFNLGVYVIFIIFTIN